MREDRPQPARRRSVRWAATPLLAIAVVLAAVLPAPAAGATTWARNLWVASAFLYQDPYYTACTAASTMIMLNTIAYRGTGGNGFTWTPYRVKSNKANTADYRDMTSILAFARRYDTLRPSSAGSDAHGWRNALNYYGWGRGAMTDPAKRPYEDRAYASFRGAVKAAVRAIARFQMPVGVLTWAGGHAQVMTGYVVEGADPRVSSDFTVKWVYLADPLRSSGVVNRKTSYEAFRDGALKYRFQWYRETDSPYDDPYTAGTMRSSVKPTVGPSEWYHRWVLILPVRHGLPAAPAPDPTPAPTPPPDPTPAAEPTPSPEPSLEEGDAPREQGSTANPVPAEATEPRGEPTPSLAPTPAAEATPTPEPVVAATSEPVVAPTPEPAAPASLEPPAAPSGEPYGEPPPGG